MIKVRQPVVVEGRYDRIRLSSVIDGIIIETGGFRVFRNKELIESLRALSKTTGLIIVTDSDGAGFKIRNFLKNALGRDAKLTHVYIPAVCGKEKRKASPSAEGLLGVEGIDDDTLAAAFRRAGVECESVLKKGDLTRADLYDAGLNGRPDSAERRRRMLISLSLPPRISTSVMLEILNTLMTREEFYEAVASIK